jgi:hypothetical protein
MGNDDHRETGERALTLGFMMAGAGSTATGAQRRGSRANGDVRLAAGIIEAKIT